MELDERKKRILGAIVEAYIATGEPVGSKALVKITKMGLSSATIRNEMYELVELGYLDQPHTSAGRIPSQAGYRLYVDKLMGRRDLTQDEIRQINKLMKIKEGDMESILEKAGEILAEVTGFAAVSTAPKKAATVLRKIELIPASRRSVLLIILTSSGVIKSRLCHVNDDLTDDMMAFFSKLINDRLSGMSLDAVNEEIISGIAAELYEYTYTLHPLLQAIEEEIRSLIKSEVFLGGESNLLNCPELDSDYLHQVQNMLDRRDELLSLIDNVKNDVEVWIGTENGFQFMRNSSIIAAPYALKGSTAGAVGIIGPKRMDYARMVSNLEYFSSVLSRLINNAFGAL